MSSGDLTKFEVDGATLAAAVVGDGDPVVLVHGTGTDRHVWDEVVPHLAAAHTVVAYDRRGYGTKTDQPPVRDYRVHGKDLLEILRMIGPAHLVGWSSGANTSLIAATADSRHIRSLTLLEPPFHLDHVFAAATLGMLAKVAVQGIRHRRADAAETFFRWVSRRMDGLSGWDRLPARMRVDYASNGGQILAELLPHPYGVLSSWVPYRRLQRLATTPVTWVIGAQSPPIWGTIRSRAMRFVPHANAVDLAAAGHFGLVEEPAAFADVVLSTIAGWGANRPVSVAR